MLGETREPVSLPVTVLSIELIDLGSAQPEPEAPGTRLGCPTLLVTLSFLAVWCHCAAKTPLCPHWGAASSSDTLRALSEAISPAPRNPGTRVDPGQKSQSAALSKHSLLCPGMRRRATRARNWRLPWLTCRGARLQDCGEQRGDDGEQPLRAPVLRGPPERSGGREGEEAAGRQRPGRRGSGRGSYLGAMVQSPGPSSASRAEQRRRSVATAGSRLPPAPDSPAH